MSKSLKIPSAGPWITDLEANYVKDAVENGWYENWSGYIDRFEESFAEYIGVKHAISTSSCTGALHILMKALEIGEGDEVIVPESTWIATATCASYVGATPVFADIEEDTWCMCPKSTEKLINEKTKAIIPVHMYGHPADMTAFMELGRKYDIAVIEDAAPGIGSKVENQMAGSFGDAAAFSFQGAKPIVTGEGGMLVTDNTELYERAYYYWDHCRDDSQILYNTDVGLKYKMSNIQAALGLAQLERIDEIIEKRRQIFFWYKDRLSDVRGLTLNTERQGYYNNFYVPTVVLGDEITQKPEDIMAALTQRGVMNRPFFRAISKMMPNYTPHETPVADRITARGINMPCASLLTEDDVKSASEALLEILDA